MKNALLLTLFCSILSTTANTQNWFESDYRWIFNLSGGFAGLNYDFELYAKSDTMILGHASKKWVTQSNSPHHSINERFTYTDGPKAFVYDPYLSNFVLIYDFSLAVGDTLTVPSNGWAFIYEIDSIDVVQAGNMTLKRQRVHRIYPNGQPSNMNFDILENIGMVGLPFDLAYPTCSYALLPDIDCNSPVDGFDIKFLCFNSNAGSYNPYMGSCALVDTKSPKLHAFNIVPNPASDLFEIQLTSQNISIQSVTLTDISGKRCQNWTGTQSVYSIAGIPAGVYFVEAIFSDGSRTVKKLVKH